MGTDTISPPQWAIGDPGRAALELPAGPPVREVGHADIAATAASLPGMEIRAAAVRGLRHRARIEPRQDAFALASRNLGDGRHEFVTVACDGVGSLPRSHEAAELVSRVLAVEARSAAGWAEAFARANAALAASTAQGEATDLDMATTAAGLTLRREDDGWAGTVAWVGDTSCWHLSPAGAWTALGGWTDDDAVYHDGRVRPLPSPDGACELETFRIDGGAVFLLTDGIANPLAWSDDVRATLASWWADAPDVLTFAGQVGFARKTHQDDRTAVGIWLQELDEVDDGPQG